MLSNRLDSSVLSKPPKNPPKVIRASRTLNQELQEAPLRSAPKNIIRASRPQTKKSKNPDTQESRRPVDVTLFNIPLYIAYLTYLTLFLTIFKPLEKVDVVDVVDVPSFPKLHRNAPMWVNPPILFYCIYFYFLRQLVNLSRHCLSHYLRNG
jgi:sterol desaturase/sphingolipid hydroxylase (fatty acid hydroxylase superfamily)